MKKKKVSFNNIKDVLSRTEMKNIMAGSGTQQCNCLYCEMSNGGLNLYASSCSASYPTAYCIWFTGDIGASGSYGIC